MKKKVEAEQLEHIRNITIILHQIFSSLTKINLVTLKHRVGQSGNSNDLKAFLLNCKIVT